MLLKVMSPSCVKANCYIDHKERNVGFTLKSIKVYTS
ncbi:unnamed protein product [Tenebrio molitor]|nr:unnamed protein product [Tenebrio molitor]